jgi:serine/threonine protein kinase
MTSHAPSACTECGLVLSTAHGLCPTCVASSGVVAGHGWLWSNDVVGGVDPQWPKIRGWTLIGSLGAGGMGRVYQAQSEADGSMAALKVLDSRWLDNPAMIARFKAEATRYARLRHPNIVQLLGTTETDDGRMCLITELVAGCDLGRLLRAESLPLARAVEIFFKTCDAVEYAREQGLLHRDIKPSNILIGRDGVVKLADFGLATEWSEEHEILATTRELTMTTDQFGSAYYLAPERLQPHSAHGPAVDVYSLGVLFYHLVSGRIPLGKYTPLSSLCELAATIDGVLSAAIEAEPAQRTTTVTKLAQQVRAVWAEYTEGASRTQRRASINRAIMIATTACALVLGGAGWQWWRTKPVPLKPLDVAKVSLRQPWRNSLGMRFVPVPETSVLFSIWEVRRSDFTAFRHEHQALFADSWLRDTRQARQERIPKTMRIPKAARTQYGSGTWEEPGFPVTPEHPACFVNPADCYLFCQWLTWRERKEGRIHIWQRYRLPTEREWLCAVGGVQAALRVGNLAGPEVLDMAGWLPGQNYHATRDAFPRTAPVGSFAAEVHGLYDLSGNVAEWVLDKLPSVPVWEEMCTARLLGPAWCYGEATQWSFSYQNPHQPRLAWLYQPRLAPAGFRVVLALKAETAVDKRSQEASEVQQARENGSSRVLVGGSGLEIEPAAMEKDAHAVVGK